MNSIDTRYMFVIVLAGPFNVVFMNCALHNRSRAKLHMIMELTLNIERGGARNHLSFTSIVANRIIFEIIFNIPEELFLLSPASNVSNQTTL